MIADILDEVRHHRAVRRSLPGGGVLHLDRGLPFLLVHRQPEGEADEGTARLVSGEAAYLLSRDAGAEDVRSLVREVAEAGSTTYGAFLVIEVWASAEGASRRFTVHAPDGPASETVDQLVEGLASLRHLRPGVEAVRETGDERHPPGLPPLLSVEESWQGEILLLGLEVPPIYRDPVTGRVYPPFLRRLQRALSKVLRQAVHEFIRVQTSLPVANPLALGTRAVPDRVWEVDRSLCEIERSFDMLLLTTPVNEGRARERFEADDGERNPRFHYRLLPMDPGRLKRRLFSLEMEAIDDPALADLFLDKRQELDTRLTMAGERGTDAFRYSSQRLYGTVDDGLRQVAEEVLAAVPPPQASGRRRVDAFAFRDAALRELAHYRERHPALDTEVQVRRDLTGLMVSRGNLLIGEGLRLDPERVEPLIQHEVGTHVLTYVNGIAQPLEQLSLGLAHYDELQEGLAVLAEYLVGGLDRARMRLLAARVLAARSVEQGAEFVDTFRLLTREHGYSRGGAWHISVRVHQCGGFTRDLIYLRGLVRLLELLAGGAELPPLYLGKIAQKHIPIIEELRYREVLRPPPLTPRFLHDASARERLARVGRGISLTEMISPESP